ncbi:MAG: prenyltransferase [Clostridiales Family XIII bacterium]|jgi:4-hydroxybenzoate polyprenyltransferase|nr:prenyltransferase [Clostridiales Family XIII bacterium]
MIKRQWIYLKEMYPLPSRLAVGFILFFELYFIVILNSGIERYRVGWHEILGALTVFAFLLLLRIADDFKDYETDQRLFPERALPSGRVKKKDLAVLLVVAEAPAIALNLLFMNNRPFFLFLYIYGFLMCMWFFQKSKIQTNLVLACVTHNPVQMIINIYVISFACIKYGISAQSLFVIMAAFTMYFPGLIWEVSRKIRAPRDETEYVTYSKIYGYRKATQFVLVLTCLDIVTNYILVWRLNTVSVFLLTANLVWMLADFVRYMKDPTRFAIVDKVIRYTFIQEGLMIGTIVWYLLFGRVYLF